MVTKLLAPLLGLLALLSAPTQTYTPISDSTLKSLPPVGSDFDTKSGSLLSPLLITRVPGSEGQAKAQNHLAGFFRHNLPSWSISWHNTTATTPLTGDRQVPFQSLILRRDPPWAAEGDVGRLTLVAHYDSKVTPEGFIGATDSAAPCAMLLHAARSIDAALTRLWEAMEEDGRAGDPFVDAKGLQILFLDGEEAWQRWTKTDSLYGARALAEHWDASFYPAMSTYHNPLNSISLFVLLDLLGHANPRVPSYFQNTHWAYSALATLESRLRGHGVMTSTHGVFLHDRNRQPHQFGRGFVDDDHMPFMQRGVPVLHLIPTPFPDVWHKITDDGDHLDIETTKDWAVLTTAFVAEWMDLEGYMPTDGHDTGRTDAGRGVGRRGEAPSEFEGERQRRTMKTEL